MAIKGGDAVFIVEKGERAEERGFQLRLIALVIEEPFGIVSSATGFQRSRHLRDRVRRAVFAGQEFVGGGVANELLGLRVHLQEFAEGEFFHGNIHAVGIEDRKSTRLNSVTS